MIGTVDEIEFDGERVLRVVLRFQGRQGDVVRSITTCELIGQGSFGTVYRALCDEYPRLALKISTGKSARLKEELEVMSRVCTKGKLNLPRFEFGALNKARDLTVIGMELCVPSTLHDLLLATKLTSEPDILSLAYQACLAVSHVHAEGCIHRDIKLQNYVFDLDGNLKLIDFGLSSSSLKPPPGDVVAGTVSFMSPEMAHNALHREKRVSVGVAADIWSIGIVLFSICSQRNPYPAKPEDEEGQQQQQQQKQASSSPSVLKAQNQRLLQRVAAGDWSWPKHCTVSPELVRLVESILVVDPEKRPTIREILGNKLFNLRRRGPPAAVSAFLGVQDDFFFSHDEEKLMKAVEQASANVAETLSKSRVASRENSPGGDSTEDEEALRRHKDEQECRDSLQVVTHESPDGEVSVQVYDVRTGSAKTKKKTLPTISQAIEKEKVKQPRGGASSSRKVTPEPPRSTPALNRSDTSSSAAANDRSTVGTDRAPPRGKRDDTRDGEEEVEEGEEEGARRSRARDKRSSHGALGTKRSRDPSPSQPDSRQATPTPPPPPRAAAEQQPESKRRPNVPGLFRKKVAVEAPRRVSPAGGRACTPPPQALASSSPPPPSSSSSSSSSAQLYKLELLKLTAAEKAQRSLLSKSMLLELGWLLSSLRLTVEEDQERYNITWLADSQIETASHPHKFKEWTRVPNSTYLEGYYCDLCEKEFMPTGKDGKQLHVFHCSCGRDLCPSCFRKYQTQCTCACCNTVHANSCDLRDHLNGTLRRQAARRSAAAAPLAAPPAKKALAKKAPAKAAKKTAAPSPSLSPSRMHPGAPLKRSSATTRKKPAKTTRMSIAAMHQRLGDDDEEDDGDDDDDDEEVEEESEEEPKRRYDDAPLRKGVSAVPDTAWRPFERLNKQRTTSTVKPPTPEEREIVLNGVWVRHYYLYPPQTASSHVGADEGEDDEEAQPYALAYHCQPGRTGAIFLTNAHPVHSAVFSVLERQFFVVEQVDMVTEEDSTFATTLLKAKAHPVLGVAYTTLEEIVAYDTNMQKQHRAPGAVSVYQAPRSAFSCRGEPVVYARWFRCSQDKRLTVFLLSNGCLQIFVNNEFEVRWYDDARKFLVRANGVCESIDENTFELMPAINRLLFQSYET